MSFLKIVVQMTEIDPKMAGTQIIIPKICTETMNGEKLSCLATEKYSVIFWDISTQIFVLSWRMGNIRRIMVDMYSEQSGHSLKPS